MLKSIAAKLLLIILVLLLTASCGRNAPIPGHSAQVPEATPELAQLRQIGLNLKPDKVLELNLENWGKVKLVSGIMDNERQELRLFLISDGKIIHELPYSFTAEPSTGIKEAKLVDVGKDGLKALIVIANHVRAVSRATDKNFTVCKVYFSAKNDFIVIPHIEQQIFRSKTAKKNMNDIDSIAELLISMDLDKSIIQSPKTISDLRLRGFIINEEKSFTVDLENWGQVRFVSGTMQDVADNVLRCYLTDEKNTILYELPNFSWNNGVEASIKEIALADINNDGLKDIVMITSHRSHYGSPYPQYAVYFQREKEFVNIQDVDEEIEQAAIDKNIDSIVAFLKTMKLDPVIIEPDKTLADLKRKNYRVIEPLSRQIHLENWGNVKLVPVIRKLLTIARPQFYLMDEQNNILYKFPTDYNFSNGIRDIGFEDINNNGLKDLIVITPAVPMNPYAKEEETVCHIYFQEGKEFVKRPYFYEKINHAQNAKETRSVRQVADFFKGNPSS